MTKENASRGMRDSFQWMFAFVKPYGGWLAAGIIGSTVIIAFNILKVYYVKGMVNYALAQQTQKLFSIIVMLAAATLAGIGATYLAKYAVGRFSTFAMRDLRKKIATHIGRLTAESIDRNHSGDMVSRLNNDVAVISGFMANDFSNLIFYPLMSASAFVFMLFINWKLLLISFVLTPSSMFISYKLSNKMSKYTKENLEYLGKGNSMLQDITSGISVVKAFNLEDTLHVKCVENFKGALRSGIKSERVLLFMNIAMIVMVESPQVICILFGGYMATKGELTLDNLLAFMFLLQYIIEPSTMLPPLVSGIGRVAGTIERLSEVMDQPVEREDGSFIENKNKDSVIEFKSVSFGYNASDCILKNISFKANQGDMIALVGASGCGKSTIISLLCGFYEPGGGSISLYCKDLKQWKLSSIREQLAFVSQDIYLFPGTIADNIMYGKPGADIDEIMSAAKVANAHKFIMEMPAAYDTAVGERGLNLSGGQRQRIAIARAILKNAPIILLDEPTSALDMQSEALIQEALECFTKDKTVIVAAHRLSTIVQADNILVIDKGRITESGTHEELLDKKGMYYQLYFRQIMSQKGGGLSA